MAKRKPVKMGPSPCKMKGRHQGRLGPGVRHRVGSVRWAPRGCECMESWLDFGFTDQPNPTRKVSAYLDEETGATRLTVEKDSEPFSKRGFKQSIDPPRFLDRARPWHTVLPCNETFRHPHSRGTKLHRTHRGKESKFRGCQKIEDELVSEKLVKHSQKEVVGTFQDYGLAQEKQEREVEEKSWQKVRGQEDNWDVKKPYTTGLAWEGAEGADGSAQTVWAHISEIPALLPKASRERWVEYLTDHFEKFELTYKQKSAVTMFLLENDDAQKVGEVAQKLRISVDSLKDRIRQVKKKVLKAYPQAADDHNLKRAKKKEKFECDFSYGGFYRKSQARIKAPLYSVNPYDRTSKLEIAFPPKTAKRRRSDLSKKERDHYKEMEKERMRTIYIPDHDGIFCPWIPVAAKAKSNGKVILDQTDYLRKLPHLRDWEKSSADVEDE